MSFGYSVGDFFTVVQFAFSVGRAFHPHYVLAYFIRALPLRHGLSRDDETYNQQVYEKCKNSGSELRDLGRDVGNAIWSSGIFIDFGKSLHGVEAIRSKYGDLNTSASWIKRATSRSKYILADMLGDIGSAREKLQRHTGNLAILHTMLTTDALREASHESSASQREALEYLKQQADIIQVFVRTYRDLQEGKENVPAYSQVPRMEHPEEQAKQTTEAAERDLQAEGIDKNVILKHRNLIKEWLETVILPVGEDDEEETVVEAQSVTVAGPNMEQDLPSNKPEGSSGPALMTKPVRSTSTSTHRSQSSTWTPDDGEMASDYAPCMIAKVLRSKYSPSAGKEAFELPLKRAFHHLDWRKSGWLARTVVEEQCYKAAAKMKWNFDRSELANAVKAEDEKHGKPDHHIDEREFTNIVLSVRERVRSAIERQSNANGVKLAAGKLSHWQGSQNEKAVSPLWTISTRYQKEFQRDDKHASLFRRTVPKYTATPYTVFSHKLGSDIGFMYLATKYVVTAVDGAFEKLRASFKGWANDDQEEVIEVLKTTIDLAANFHRFESPDGLNSYHWLDKLIDDASVLPLSHCPELCNCPLRQATNLVAGLWTILDDILGLVWDILFFATGALILGKWREFRLLDRARALAAQTATALSQGMANSFEEIQGWYHEHQSNLIECRAMCDQLTETLRKKQEAIADSLSGRQIIISSLYLSEVPKILGFRRPSVFFTTWCDKQKHDSSDVKKSTDPFWRDYTMNVKLSSTIKIRFYRTTNVNEALGWIEFKVKESVDFARGARVSLVKPINSSGIEATLVVEPAFGKRHPAPFTLPESYETDEEEAKRKILELPLPSYILSQPIPDGWEVRRTSDDDGVHDGVYFWNVETLKPTAVFWRDPLHKIDQNVKYDQKQLQEILQPVRYHFPEAFGVAN
ncbi:hypothetical protein NA57DRAFT_54227 [Rhizodiscina lignyota]|uniref:C2 domain-containing protein n=1 Tax=Rhizodiscina lignyota TaxID=1504668 RepID=A0A9P4M935_9PEZI|nr:hypothetical protein NA57DRAFT_54227 [Rhizodiscina lignyota]